LSLVAQCGGQADISTQTHLFLLEKRII